VLHEVLDIVHCSTVLTPGAMDIPELYRLISVIVAEPLTILQAPVPGDGLFAARVNVGLLHCVWSEPADACGAFERVTSSEVLQVVLSIVHFSTVITPGAMDTPVVFK